MVILPREIQDTFSENYMKTNRLHTIDKPIFKKRVILPLKIVSTLKKSEKKVNSIDLEILMKKCIPPFLTLKFCSKIDSSKNHFCSYPTW